MNDRLYRSSTDRVLAGVAGGLAERLDLDPSLVRVGWVLLTIVSGGIFLVIYVVMALVVPEEPISWPGAWGPPAAPGVGAVPGAPAGATTGAATGAAAGAASEAMAASGGPTAAGPERTTDSPPAGPPPGPGWSAGPAGAGGPGDPGGATGPGGPGGPGWTLGTDPWSRAARREARRAARRANREPGSGPLVIGLLLILVGAWALARTFYPALDVDRWWPILLVVLGVVLIAGSVRRNPPSPN